MFSDNVIGIFLSSERLKREKARAIQSPKSFRGAVQFAFIVALCSVVPMNMAAAQSIPAERGHQNAVKPSDTKKKIIKSQSASAKFVRPVYLGGAPYVCTPSGFGHTSKCFLR